MGESFQQIIDGLERGDDAASAEVVSRFGDRLLSLARSRLSEPVRKRIDAEDVIQSVFRTFFRRKKEGEFDLEDWESLKKLLVGITLRKVGKKIESIRAEKRDIRRERNLESGSATREPSPDEILIAAELLELLTEGLRPKDQQILSLRLAGHTLEEVGRQVNLTKRSVIRTMDRVKAKLVRLGEINQRS